MNTRSTFLSRQVQNPIVLVIMVGLSLIFGYLFVSLSRGSNTTLYINPPNGTTRQNTIFAISVRLNTGGESVNAVQANINYPVDKLQFLSINNNGSAFGYSAPSQGGNGSVKIARTTNPGEPGVTGNVLVSTITFKAISASGYADITFDNTSGVARSNGDGINILSGTTGSLYSFSPPLVEPPSPSPITPTPTPTPNPTPTPTSTPTTPPIITSPTPIPHTKLVPIPNQTRPTPSANSIIPPAPPIAQPAITNTQTDCDYDLRTRLKPYAIGGLIIILIAFVSLGIIRWKMERDRVASLHPKHDATPLVEPLSPTVTYPTDYQDPKLVSTTTTQPAVIHKNMPGSITLPSASPAIMTAVIVLAVGIGLWTMYPGNAAVEPNGAPASKTCPV